MKLRALLAALVLALVGGFAPMAQAQMKLQFYYPVGVAGPLARFIDGYVQEWNKTHPQVQVEPVFAGGYTEAYAKTLAAIQAGTPPDVAVMLSQNLNDIISQDIVIPLDELIAADAGQVKMDDFFPAFMLNSSERRQGVVHPLPALDAGHVLQQGSVQGSRARPEQAAPDPGGAGGSREKADQDGRAGGRPAGGSPSQSSGGVDTWLFEGAHHRRRRPPLRRE